MDVLDELQRLELQAVRDGEARGIHGQRPQVRDVDPALEAALFDPGSEREVIRWSAHDRHATEVVDVTRRVRTGWFERDVTVRVVRNVPGPRR